MTTEEVVALRKRLELDVLALLRKFKEDTGLTPASVDVQTIDVTALGGTRRMELCGVRVTVEV